MVLYLNNTNCQIKQPIYSVLNNTIVTNNGYIDAPFYKQYSNITPFIVVHSFNISTNGGSNNYNIILSRYKGWEEEEGDFEIVDIVYNNQNIFNFVNQEGMLLNQQFFQIDSTTSLIYFTSVPYNSNPGYLTLVILKGDKAYLVYNKISHIKSVGYINGVFTIKIIDQFAEYSEVDSNVQINNPIESDITYENGVLYIKQITSL